MRGKRKRFAAGLLTLCMLFTMAPGGTWEMLTAGETDTYAQENETDIASEDGGVVSASEEETDNETNDAALQEAALSEEAAQSAAASVADIALTAAESAAQEQEEKVLLLALANEAAEGTLQDQINAIDALRTSEQPTDIMSGTITLNPAYDNGSGLYTENLVIPEYTDITIDLNGCTLMPAMPTEEQFYLQSHITVYGSLTITDSSAQDSTGSGAAEGGEASGSQNGTGKLSGGGVRTGAA